MMAISYGCNSLQGSWSQHWFLLPSLAMSGLGFGTGMICPSLKRSRVVCNEPGEDLISELPEDVLCLILSQLPTEEAVRTSILSKRWRNLHVFLPRLSLKCPCAFKEPSRQQEDTGLLDRYKRRILTFIDQFIRLRQCTCDHHRDNHGILTFMDRFLQLRQGCSIKSFQLSCCLGEEFSSHVEQWMKYAARSNIEELVLRFSCDDPGCTRGLITFPFQGRFRYLSLLRLDAVSLVNVELDSIFSACPKLESLMLTYCRLPSCLLMYYRVGDMLKSFTMTSCIGVKSILLCAWNLTSLEIVCSQKIDIFLSGVPKLKHLFLGLKYSAHLSYIIDKVIKNLPELESLYVESRVSEINYFSRGREFNNFVNLKEVYVLINFGDTCGAQRIASLISCSPFLRKCRLVTNGTRDREIPAWPYWRNPTSDHIHLKEVEIGGFQGHAAELELISYILRIAVHLERMTVSKGYEYYVGGGKWEKSAKQDSVMDRNQREALRELARVASPIVQLILH